MRRRRNKEKLEEGRLQSHPGTHFPVMTLGIDLIFLMVSIMHLQGRSYFRLFCPRSALVPNGRIFDFCLKVSCPGHIKWISLHSQARGIFLSFISNSIAIVIDAESSISVPISCTDNNIYSHI